MASFATESSSEEEEYLEELEYARNVYASLKTLKPEVCKTLEAMWSYIPKE